MKRLRIATLARADLQEIKRYTQEQWGSEQALLYLARLKARLAGLRERPDRGRHRDELRTGLRSLLCERHVIFFRESANRILIVRVLHSSMDTRSRLPSAASRPDEPVQPQPTRSETQSKVKRKR
jgi:toxin ParE1/3/4